MSARELPCHAALFDMDGVLVDSRASVERTWRAWAARHGLDADGIMRVAHGRKSSDTIREFAPHLDIPAAVADLDAAELEDVDGIVPIPGARELLRELPPDAWAIFTSCGPELARRRLAAAGMPLPRVLVTAGDVRRGKPSPDGWLMAAELLGVGVEHCVVVEDAPHGLKAALEIHVPAIGVLTTHTRDQLPGAAAYVLDQRQVLARTTSDRLVALIVEP